MLKRLLNKAIFDQDLYAYYLTVLNPLLIELFENPKISVHILEPNILSPKIKERFEALQLYTEQLVQLLTDSISDFPGCLEFNKIFDGTMPVPHKLLTTYEHNRFHINSDNKIVNCTDSQRHLVMGYFALIKHLIMRIMMYIDNGGFNFKIHHSTKLCLKYFASIIYLSIKDYVVLKTSSKYHGFDEDIYRHLFFGADLLRAIDKQSPSWFASIQTKVVEYIEKLTDFVS